MAKKIYTKDELNTWTVDNLRDFCKNLEIPKMSKQRKDVIISEILAKQGGVSNNDIVQISVANSTVSGTPAKDDRPIVNMVAVMNMNASNPSDKNSKMNTTIHVSCGASSGNFSVVGKSVGEVAAKLKGVLNISNISVGIVNGKEVSDGYLLKDGDNLEFIKPAGTKGTF